MPLSSEHIESSFSIDEFRVQFCNSIYFRFRILTSDNVQTICYRQTNDYSMFDAIQTHCNDVLIHTNNTTYQNNRTNDKYERAKNRNFSNYTLPSLNDRNSSTSPITTHHRIDYFFFKVIFSLLCFGSFVAFAPESSQHRIHCGTTMKTRLILATATNVNQWKFCISRHSQTCV